MFLRPVPTRGDDELRPDETLASPGVPRWRAGGVFDGSLRGSREFISLNVMTVLLFGRNLNFRHFSITTHGCFLGVGGNVAANATVSRGR